MSMRDEPLDRRRERFLRDFFENSELYTFGIITQKGYKDLEDRLTAHAAEVQRRFHRWFRRHDDTSRRLLRAMRVAIRRNPERREQIRQSSEVSLGLIDSLVPKQNCVQVVREATH
jgi:hypothetical protein